MCLQHVGIGSQTSPRQLSRSMLNGGCPAHSPLALRELALVASGLVMLGHRTFSHERRCIHEYLVGALRSIDVSSVGS